jgi:hypothetical protein
VNRTTGFLLALCAIASVWGCPSAKPTQDEVQAARSGNATMRQIDQAKAIAAEDSSRSAESTPD